MKTKIKRHSRSVLSVVLSLCMLVSCMTVGIIATDAAKVTNSEAVAAKMIDNDTVSAQIEDNNNAVGAQIEDGNDTVGAQIEDDDDAVGAQIDKDAQVGDDATYHLLSAFVLVPGKKNNGTDHFLRYWRKNK